jgi:HAMP domain-containing protein
VNFGQPILDPAGHVTGVVFAALDLGWLNEFARRAAAPPGSTFTVVDRAGVVLARYPNGDGWIGKLTADTALIALVLKRGKGVAEVSGVDGVPQLFGFTPLDERRDSGAAFVSIGIPSTAAYADVRRLLLWNLVGLVIAGLVVLLATYQFADRLILRRMDALVTATDRLARGDVRVRTGLAQEQGELGHLGRAFDSMAEALAQRQAENERRRREAERLAEIGRAILQAGGPAEAGQRIADSLRELLRGTAATVYRVEPGSEDLVAVASSGDQGPIEGRLSLGGRGRGGGPGRSHHVP